ncbi:MAG: 8-amino-7-oxononanoate synthase [Bacteroidales bacterium]
MPDFKHYTDFLDICKQTDNLRTLKVFETNNYVNFSTNDYLGIARNREMKQEFSSLYKDLALSASSSRLITGNSALYQEVEKLVATFYNKEACLLYNSGYHVNIGILPSLATPTDLIISDKNVHASIIDGIRLSRCDFERYNHLDYTHLDLLLAKKRKQYRNVFIVSESIFSMDGDCADLHKLVELKNKYDAMLYIDEAHALGVRGSNGIGLCEEMGLIDEIDFIIGTCGKALGSQGGFVVCTQMFKEYLINTSRSLIYTTALPPYTIAWLHFILGKLQVLQPLRKKIYSLRQTWTRLFQTPTDSHIIPMIIGENTATIELANYLTNNGFLVFPIRYPTVAKGKARLRFSVSSDINFHDIEKLFEILQKKDTYKRI